MLQFAPQVRILVADRGGNALLGSPWMVARVSMGWLSSAERSWRRTRSRAPSSISVNAEGLQSDSRTMTVADFFWPRSVFRRGASRPGPRETGRSICSSRTRCTSCWPPVTQRRPREHRFGDQ